MLELKSLAGGERAEGVVNAIAQGVLRASASASASEPGSYLGSELQLSASEQQALERGVCDGPAVSGAGADAGAAAAGFRPVSRQQASAEALACAYAGRGGGGGAQELANSALASATDALFGSDSNLFAAACGSAAGASTGVGVRPLTEADQVLLNMLQRLLYELMDAVPDAEGDADDSDPGVGTGAVGGVLAGSGSGSAGPGASGGVQAARAVPECEQSPEAFLRITDAFIRRFIKFCKCLPEFAVLPQDDQIALLKVCPALSTPCPAAHVERRL